MFGFIAAQTRSDERFRHFLDKRVQEPDPTGGGTDIIHANMANLETVYSVADRVATITLNRPDKLNAWTAVMDQEVREAIYEAEADSNVRVIILTGAGRGFCAGADMSLLGAIAQEGLEGYRGPESFLRNTSNGERQNVRPDFQKKYSYFPSIQKPVIAAVNGPAVGLGFILTLYCDLRFASETGRFGTAFAKRGLIAEYGLAWMLPRLVGPANALDMLFSARLVDAERSAADGFGKSGVSAGTSFMQGVNAYAQELVNNVSPRSMGIIKTQVYDAMFQTLGEAFETAEQEMVKSLQCEDFKEGVAHFVEKRAPVFTGRHGNHMNFRIHRRQRSKSLQQRLRAFMDEHIYPNEQRYLDEINPDDRWQPSRNH